MSIAIGASVIGYGNGIDANQAGSGALSITGGTGSVVGRYGPAGIFAGTAYDSTDLTIDIGASVSGNYDGIRADHEGSGTLSIAVAGAVTGSGATGIYAYGSSNGEDVIIDAGSSVSGSSDGIFARQMATGALTITSAAGAISASGGEGIDAENTASGADMTLDLDGGVNGSTTGIRANQLGSGALSITTGAGAVTGANGEGIAATTSATSTGLVIDASGDVSGSAIGIFADHAGTGALSVTAGSGSISATGVGGGYTSPTDGIYANNSPSGDALTIDVGGAVDGIEDAIDARQAGSGDLSIALSGAATGGSGYGIRTETGAGGNTVIDLAAGAVVSSSAGLGILNDAGDSSVTVRAGASVTGVIRLGDGSDTLTLEGGDLSGVSVLDGGDDIAGGDGFTDRVIIRGSAAALPATAAVPTGRTSETGIFTATSGALFENWEEVVIGDSAVVSFDNGTLTTGTLTVANNGFLRADSGLTLASDLIIESGGRISVQGGGSGVLNVTGSAQNDGVIDTIDGAVGDRVVVDGDYAGGGEIRLDIDTESGTADQIVVSGDAVGTTVTISNLTPEAAAQEPLAIFIVDGNLSGDFTVVSADPNVAVDSSLSGGRLFVVTSLSAPAIYEAAPSALFRFAELPTLAERSGQRLWHESALMHKVGPLAGMWVRVVGDRLDGEMDTSDRGTAINSDFAGLQIGADWLVSSDERLGDLVLGVSGQTGHLNSNVTSDAGNGRIDGDSVGLGGSLTWGGASGFYLDLQARADWINLDLRTDADGELASNERVMALGAGVEAGWALAFGKGLSIVPQAQLQWGRLLDDQFDDDEGTRVDFATNDRFLGRLGSALSYDSEFRSAGRTQFQFSANLLYDFSENTQVDVGTATAKGGAEELWAEIGLGGSYQIVSIDSGRNGAPATKAQLHAGIDYKTSLTGGITNNQAIGASAGLRFSW